VLHRDLKPQNILLNSNSTCDLVVCDFGLSRVLDPARPPRLSEFVVTRWYRAPEVTLTLNQYSSKMDVWSVGCILAEMLAGQPLFPGTNAIDQMQRILAVIGSPAEEDLTWISSESTREYMRSLPHRPRVNFADLFPGVDPLALDLLAALLRFNPDRRPSAGEALTHPYFLQRDYHCPEAEVRWRALKAAPGIAHEPILFLTLTPCALFLPAPASPSQPEADIPLSVDEMTVESLTMDRVREEFVAEANRFHALQVGGGIWTPASVVARPLECHCDAKNRFKPFLRRPSAPQTRLGGTPKTGRRGGGSQSRGHVGGIKTYSSPSTATGSDRPSANAFHSRRRL
jgi:hypothetical protein